MIKLSLLSMFVVLFTPTQARADSCTYYEAECTEDAFGNCRDELPAYEECCSGSGICCRLSEHGKLYGDCDGGMFPATPFALAVQGTVGELPLLPAEFGSPGVAFPGCETAETEEGCEIYCDNGFEADCATLHAGVTLAACNYITADGDEGTYYGGSDPCQWGKPQSCPKHGNPLACGNTKAPPPREEPDPTPECVPYCDASGMWCVKCADVLIDWGDTCVTITGVDATAWLESSGGSPTFEAVLCADRLAWCHGKECVDWTASECVYSPDATATDRVDLASCILSDLADQCCECLGTCETATVESIVDAVDPTETLPGACKWVPGDYYKQCNYTCGGKIKAACREGQIPNLDAGSCQVDGKVLTFKGSLPC